MLFRSNALLRDGAKLVESAVDILQELGIGPPGTGEIGWRHVFRRMDELGYQGWVGCEYRPAGDTVAGLGWIKAFTA